MWGMGVKKAKWWKSRWWKCMWMEIILKWRWEWYIFKWFDECVKLIQLKQCQHDENSHVLSFSPCSSYIIHDTTWSFMIQGKKSQGWKWQKPSEKLSDEKFYVFNLNVLISSWAVLLPAVCHSSLTTSSWHHLQRLRLHGLEYPGYDWVFEVSCFLFVSYSKYDQN